MTDHETTNPPGPGNPPSSTSPADAGGAVEVAVPPAGRGKKIKPSWRYVLDALAASEGRVLSEMELPDGCGRHGCARVETLRKLENAGLVQHAREHAPQFGSFSPYRYGYRITDAGRRLLKEGK